MSADEDIEKAKTLVDTNLIKAVNQVNTSILKYIDTISQAKDSNFNELIDGIQGKLDDAENFESELRVKIRESYGIEPVVPDVITEDQEGMAKSFIESDKKKYIISAPREYEFIGGQVRFKLAIINNTNFPLTEFVITFVIPNSLKWIAHEPGYERKGDSIFIEKLGKNEKKSISLYLEPISCMESPINATISFHDIRDKPRALIMEPKMISISCPIFFTKEEVNLARVKSLKENLIHHDKKTFPISNPKNVVMIFETILNVLGNRDIKLVSKTLSENNKYGEAWFYGTTKVRKKGHIISISVNGEKKILELEASGDDEDQITGFLADISRETREKLVNRNLISSEDRFLDMRVSIASRLCPYCLEYISKNLVEKFYNGESIKCKNCDVQIDVLKT